MDGGMGLEGASQGWQQQNSELLLGPVPTAPGWGLAGFTASAAWRTITTLWFFQTRNLTGLKMIFK